MSGVTYMLEEKQIDYQQQLSALLSAPVPPRDSLDYLSRLYSLANCYYNLRRYAEELTCREEILSIAKTPTNLNNLAVSYENNGIRRNVLNLYKRALESEPFDAPSSVIYGNLLRYVARYRVYERAKTTRLHPRTYINDISTILRFAVACYEDYEWDTFSLADSITISPDCPDIEKYSIIKTIFDSTKGLQEKTLLRLYLISLYHNATAILDGHRTSIRDQKLEIAHYTRVENLKSLLKANADTFQRLFNVAYMNDPSEGKTFDHLLKCYGTKLSQSTTSSCAHNGRNYQSYGYSNTYIGSFSSSIDSLPMWVQYGNGGKGCCLIFENSFFDEEEPLLLHMSKPAAPSELTSEDALPSDPPERYVLYKVYYLSEPSKYPYRTNLQMIARLYNQLQELLEKMDKTAVQQITIYIDSILDQIRFLFKEPDYAHEQEYRVIKWADSPLCDEGNRSGEVPHLYIEMARPLEYKEVILGPKVEAPSAVAPYLHYTKKVKRITKSNIQYQ